MGVRPEMLYRWRSEFSTLQGGSFPDNGKKKMIVEESEFAHLKKELH